MKEKKTVGSYEVGYGKPPKNTQFQKSVSGNPRGRPKKSLNFDQELIRESKSFMNINENGRRKRITKREVVFKQLTKQAITGSPQALRIYLALLQQAHERVTLVEGPQPGKHKEARELTEEELTRIVLDGMKKTERKSEK